MNREDDESPGQGMGRLLALSDGVFAFAITLLVVNLNVASGQSLDEVLRHIGFRAWAAALSFAIIGRYWLIHRKMFARIAHQDELLAVLNLVFLAAIVAMPFATELLAVPGERAVQVIVYASTIGAAGLTGTVIWAYAWTRERLVDPRLSAAADAPAVFASGLGGLVTMAICLVSIAVAAADPRAGELIWIAFLVPNRWTSRWLRPLGGWLLAISKRLHSRRLPQPGTAD
jgi:uncharacterized membrane protein